jgi:hypothetical protein
MKLGAALACVLLGGCITQTTETPDGPTSSFTFLYGDYFSGCRNCHAPGVPGHTSDIEQALDFSSKAMAFQTITTGTATGLMGNFAGCNGVPFVAATPANSLILAVVDQPTRIAFDLSGHASCVMNSISDETAKVRSAPSAQFIASLRLWIMDGTPND